MPRHILENFKGKGKDHSGRKVDASGETYGRRERKEAREILQDFEADSSKRTHVDDWVRYYSDPPGRPDPNPPFDYSKAEASAATAEPVNREYYPEDLDGPTDKEVRAYERKRDSYKEKTLSQFNGLVMDYYSNVQKLNGKYYSTFKKRQEAVNQCYKEFVDETQNMLLQQTIKMRKLCNGIGLPGGTNDFYTSEAEHGGRFQLPYPPYYEEDGALVFAAVQSAE